MNKRHPSFLACSCCEELSQAHGARVSGALSEELLAGWTVDRALGIIGEEASVVVSRSTRY